jgi:hypothetical protein
MQPPDSYDAGLKESKLRAPKDAQGAAATEFVTRLTQYGELLSAVKVEQAVDGVLDGILKPVPQSLLAQNKFVLPDKDESDEHRDNLRKDLAPLIGKILAMEQRWFHNVCKAHEAAEKYLGENQESFAIHSDLGPATKKVERIQSQQKTVQGWSLGVAKGKRLLELKGQLDRAVERQEKIEIRYGESYFEGLRVYLRGAGFLVSPSYLPPAAVFPREDWVSLDFDDPSYEDLAAKADELMMKYQMLGTPYAGLLYNSNKQSKCGCACISWVASTCVADKDKRVMVPVLGCSGGAPKPVSVEAVLGGCALPPYTSLAQGQQFGSKPLEKAKKQDNNEEIFNQYYDDIMARANNLAINYRVRELLKLRLPSRQAMLSYLGLSFFRPTDEQREAYSDEIEPTPAVASWHSFNCAEPAALTWITSFFVDGQDVYLCCPYEGSNNPGKLGLMPKETCPWCATVEIAYRSLKKVPKDQQGQWPDVYDESMKTGEWAREISLADTFKGAVPDKAWREDIPRNWQTLEPAYPDAVNENVAVLRGLFREVGLLNKKTIRVGERALWQEF